MIEIFRLFDSYGRQARLYPALLTILPLLATAIVWFPALQTVGHMIVGLLVTCGAIYLLADIARTRGKRIEASLLAEWGGWPTTIWLRHRDRHLPGGTRHRYHDFFASQPVLGPMPTPIEENVDPHAADDRYASAVDWLKERCRGPAFPLVQKELATYGFRRNLLGLKPFGIVLSSLGIAFPGIQTVVLTRNPADVLYPYENLAAETLGIVALCALALAGWLFLIRPIWVREAADQYARALLSCCDTLYVTPSI